MTLRVYLPSTLLEVRADAPLPARTAYAVTPRLRREQADEDEESLEYAAYRDAVDASAWLLAHVLQAPPRRVVLAAELEEDQVDFSLSEHAADAGPAEGSAAAVRLRGPVDWLAVVALHVDDSAVSPDVSAAIDGDVQAAGRLQEEELAWYDITERATLEQ